MTIQYSLESQDSAVGGKRALIVTPKDDKLLELVFNIDTYQHISESPEKAELKRESNKRKIEQQLQKAEKTGDLIAVEKLKNELRFGGGEHIFEQILKFVNMFFEMIDEEDAYTFYNYLYDAQTLIHGLDVSNNSEISKNLTAITTAMMNKLDLARKLIRFTEYVKLPLPDGSEIGTRSHHSANKTFSVRDPENPDYLEMTAVSLFSKVMFPVWGEYCHKMKRIGIGSIDKEFYCLQFCEQGIDQSAFHRIYNKFRSYVYDEVKRELNRTSSNSHGNESNFDKNNFIIGTVLYDETRFEFLQLAKLIVKRLTVFNVVISSLKGENNVPNIMIFLQAIIKTNVANTLKQFNKRNRLLAKDEPKGSEDDNFTFMENCSRISKFSPDHPIYIRRGVELALPREIIKRGLSLDHFEEIVDFYRGNNLLIRNVFTDSILSIYLFPIIGGSVNLSHLKAKQYIMAIAYCQLILFSQTKSYGVSLGLMLSSKTSLTPRENKIDPVTTYIQAMSEKSDEYQSLMDRYPHSCEIVMLNESIIGSKPKGERKDKVKGTINIAKHVAIIKNWIIDYDHYTNLCPLLWSYFPNVGSNARQKQNDILQYSEHIVEDYYNFVLDVCHPVQEEDKNTVFWKEMGFS